NRIPERRGTRARAFAHLVSGVAALASCSCQSSVPASPLGDWTGDAPGVKHTITPADLPPPNSTDSAENPSKGVPRPPDAWPKVPAGFTVNEFAVGLTAPRIIEVAPNGDVFVVESNAGRVK